MKVIKPVQVYPENLITSNITELYPNWSVSTPYTVGQTVVRPGKGVYECISANTGIYPEGATTVAWLYVSPTNKLAMFDSQISTTTKATGSLTATIKTGAIDSIALLNVLATTVTVTVRASLGGAIVYGPVTQSLQGDTLLDWYDYFYFDDSSQRTQVIFLGSPNGIADAHTEIEVAGTGPVSVGAFVIGSIKTLGKTEFGATAGITDYSSKETDEYGNTVFVIRDFSKRVNVDIQIDNFDLNKTQRVLYNLRATPALWLVSSDARYEEPMTVYGFYRDFTTSITYPTISRCSIEIEGLI